MEKFIYSVPGVKMYFSTEKTLRVEETKSGEKHTIYDGRFAFVFNGVKYNAAEKIHYAESMSQIPY